MTSLTLISHPLCPFVQRAAIVLLEKGIPFDRIDVNLASKPDWFLGLSPTGKVPLLRVRRSNEPDVVLFESMAICEYLEESQDGAKLYPVDALARARQRGWIEFATATLTDAWQFLNAKEKSTADNRRAALRTKLLALEGVLAEGPYFGGATFGMVDAVFAPIFENLPRVSAWRAALAGRPSVIAAVREDYPERFRNHLREHESVLAR